MTWSWPLAARALALAGAIAVAEVLTAGFGAFLASGGPWSHWLVLGGFAIASTFVALAIAVIAVDLIEYLRQN
jgi:hypothetical protein